MDITSVSFADPSKVTVTLPDGSTKEFVDPATVNPPVAPGTTEVDLLHTDGTVEKFVKAQ